MREIYVWTFAYNAEKTLCRAIESILNQTYPYFIYYILDNGSIDATRELIEKYAAKDSRIVPFFADKNHVFTPEHNIFVNLPKNIPDNDLLCILDADDEYNVSFFEKAVKFLDKHNLDIVCCGSTFVSATENKLLGYRLLEQDLIITGHQFAGLFPIYYGFMRSMWGKLSKGYCVREFDIKTAPDDRTIPDYGLDTYYVMSSFKLAKRVGIMSGTAIKYYVSDSSGSKKMSTKRIISDRILYDVAIDFLSLYGPISPENNDFLLKVYFHAIQDTMNVLINATIDLSEKLEGLKDIFTNEHTKQLIDWQGFGQEKAQLFGQVAEWAISQEAVFIGSNTGVTKEILEIYRNFLTLMLEVLEEVQGSKVDNIRY